MFSTPTNVPASGNVSTTPPITTTYTLACVNSNYIQNANNPISSSATVTVSGSGYCEQNPNGVGCQ
jgi:aspartate carbamoyltransferase regulatory subunit